MNESILIRLQCDGKNIPVDSLNADGLTLARETSAAPRAYRLSLSPATPATVFRWNRVRQIQAWQPHEFHLSLQPDSEGIVVSGIDADSLPEGRYSLRLEVADMLAVDQPVTVELQFGAQAKVTVKFRSDRRKFQLVTKVKDFDPKIKAVIDASTLDGLDAAKWLESSEPRAQRQACLLNILAKLRVATGVQPRTQLIAEVNSVFWGDVDRVYAKTQAGLLAQLETLSADPAKPFYREGTPKAKVHSQLVADDPAAYDLLSFRQEGAPSLQCVVATPNAAGADSVAEFDLDLGNALQDLAGAVVHIGELLNPGKTDHLALAEKLSRGPTGDFSYYRVVR